MARVAFTLRIDTEERVALENLSQVEGRPAIAAFLEAEATLDDPVEGRIEKPEPAGPVQSKIRELMGG